MRKILSVLLALIGVIMLTACSGLNAAEKTAKQFMKYLQEESTNDIKDISTLDVFNQLFDELWGINIINYNVKSVSDEYKVKHVISVHNLNRNDKNIQDNKEYFGEIYPDYIVLKDTDTEWTIQSPDNILSEYRIIFDVEYSNLAGNTKRNSVTVIVTQRDPDSDTMIVTDVYGFIN